MKPLPAFRVYAKEDYQVCVRMTDRSTHKPEKKRKQ